MVQKPAILYKPARRDADEAFYNATRCTTKTQSSARGSLLTDDKVRSGNPSCADSTGASQRTKNGYRSEIKAQDT